MGTLTNNKDIDYINKDFYSAEDAMISYANVNFGTGTSANRLWTNFNIDSFSRNWLEIVAYIADTLYFYFDVQATQNYLQTATIISVVQDIAKQFGFTPATAASASGLATFTTTAATTIPRGFKVSASNGSQFYVTNDIVATSAGQFTGTVLEGSQTTQTFTSTGLQNEEFNLAGPNIIVDSSNVNPADISPQVSVSGNDYTLVSSFIQFNGTNLPVQVDSIGNIILMGGRVYTLGTRPDGTPFIRFGDGIFGRKLNAGETITVIYRTGGGSAGNIAASGLTTLVSSNSLVTSVTNYAAFSGGVDAQTIDQLRDLIPASLRTIQRAVALQDYSDLIISTFSQVFTASAEMNTENPGLDLNIYVVPQGLGIPQISDNPTLKNEIFNFVDKRKTVTVQFQILDAFGVNVVIAMTAHLEDTTSRATVTQSIQSALTNFFSLTTGGPNGTGVGFAAPILFKDIIAVLETVPGIVRFELNELSYHPRVDNRTVSGITKYNIQPISIFPNVSKSEWLVSSNGVISESSSYSTFINSYRVNYQYNSISGLITYYPSFALPSSQSFVNLSGVASGDTFVDEASATFTIHGVDYKNFTITLLPSLSVTTPAPSTPAATILSGSVTNGATTYQSYRVFKRSLQTVTNFSLNTTHPVLDGIVDSNLDLTVYQGTGVAVESTVLLDRTQVFVSNSLAGGQYLLVDSSGNIWQILSNDSSSIRTSTQALNDASITTVAAGAYRIVKSLQGYTILFQNSVFPVTQPFNTHNTIFSAGIDFSSIGNIGNSFILSKLQSNLGSLGMAVDITAFNPGTKVATIVSSVAGGYFDLQGVNDRYVLIDSTNQIFKVSAVDNSTGTKTVTLESDQTPQLGIGATLVQRYYDDNSEVVIVIGVTDGIPTQPDPAQVADEFGKSYVGGIYSNVDSFIFRTSPYVDDIVNLRAMEIPQIQLSDIIINLFGGVA